MYFKEHSAKLKLKIKFKKIFVVSPKRGNIFFDLIKGIFSFYVSDLRPSKGQYKNAKTSLGVRIWELHQLELPFTGFSYLATRKRSNFLVHQ